MAALLAVVLAAVETKVLEVAKQTRTLAPLKVIKMETKVLEVAKQTKTLAPIKVPRMETKTMDKQTRTLAPLKVTRMVETKETTTIAQAILDWLSHLDSHLDHHGLILTVTVLSMTANLLTLAVAVVQEAVMQGVQEVPEAAVVQGLASMTAVILEPARMVVAVVQGKAAPLLG